jgi:hypothetical protein
MRSIASRFLSCSFALAVVALGGRAACADQVAPAPAAASTSAPVDVNIDFKNGTTYSGGATIAYPKGVSVNQADAAKSVQFVNGKAPSRGYALTLNGPGKITYADGSSLTTLDGGEFTNGVIEGQGEYVKPGAFDFKGNYSDGLAKAGTVTYANGSVYDGTLDANGLPSGQGTLTTPGGSRYEGPFENGLPSGPEKGTLTATGPITEESGVWNKGILTGYAIYSDGSRFDGTFDADGKADGPGTLRSPGGTVITGTWSHGNYVNPMTIRFHNGDVAVGPLSPSGELNGQGSYAFHDGPRLSRATFRNGELDGPATLTTRSGRTYQGRIERNVFIGPHYKQYFGTGGSYDGSVDSRGRANGRGLYRYPDGETLSGTWVHGRMSGAMIDRVPGGSTWTVRVSPPADFLHGPATITFPNGDRATGPLEHGTLNGAGSYVYAANGNRIDGTFADGRLRGPATLTTPDGDRFEGKMQNGTVQ